MSTFDGKVAVVSGSARGIGRATADLLAAGGARVVLDDLDGEVAERAAADIVVCATDLAQPRAPERLIDTAIAT